MRGSAYAVGSCAYQKLTYIPTTTPLVRATRTVAWGRGVMQAFGCRYTRASYTRTPPPTTSLTHHTSCPRSVYCCVGKGCHRRRLCVANKQAPSSMLTLSAPTLFLTRDIASMASTRTYRLCADVASEYHHVFVDHTASLPFSTALHLVNCCVLGLSPKPPTSSFFGLSFFFWLLALSSLRDSLIHHL